MTVRWAAIFFIVGRVRGRRGPPGVAHRRQRRAAAIQQRPDKGRGRRAENRRRRRGFAQGRHGDTPKASGHTTLVIWETGASPVRYEITVVTDTSELDHMHAVLGGRAQSRAARRRRAVQRQCRDDGADGQGRHADQSKRAEAIASAHAKKVVNMIQVPPPPDPRQILLQVKFAERRPHRAVATRLQSVQPQRSHHSGPPARSNLPALCFRSSASGGAAVRSISRIC